ncbi:MAG: Gfo/Idh/MocA family oxidoreductase [Bacteroidota bacterium]
MKKLRGVAVGAGYFSHFQYEAWNRIPEVEITALCNRGEEKGKQVQQQYSIQNFYTDYLHMLDQEKPDFVDIITPPDTHLEMTKLAVDRGIHVICQKPLAPTYQEAHQLVQHAEPSGARLMIHENWRFQPWYREIKQMIDQEVIGQVHTAYFRKRMGDGWGEDAYIPRQPYFREYPRLIVYENGIHFIDTFRYLFGEVKAVFARLRKLNPVIQGEDWAIIHFEFANGMEALWDANRYNEPNYENPRFTFGEMLIDGLGGSIRLYPDGRLSSQPLGAKEEAHTYEYQDVNFSGDCVYATQRHFINCLLSGEPFETNGPDYLQSLKVQEATYLSAAEKRPVKISELS